MCRLDPSDPVPAWAACEAPTGTSIAGGLAASSILCVCRAPGELSIVAPESAIPPEAMSAVRHQAGLVALRVAGPLDFSIVGVLAELSAALAGAAVPVFVISTFDTDVLLIPMEREQQSRSALEAAGWAVG